MAQTISTNRQRLDHRGFALVISAVGAAILSPASAAVAESEPRSSLGLRISTGLGALEGEAVWAVPGVDVVAAMLFGADQRGYAAIELGYSPIDSHTNLADGRMVTLSSAVGLRVGAKKHTRVGVLVALEDIRFHADPDVLAENPDVDLLASRGGLVPVVGLQASFDLVAGTAVGLYARGSLTQLVLFENAAGDEARSRLFMAGAFIEFRRL